jgi:hypothetical protein
LSFVSAGFQANAGGLTRNSTYNRQPSSARLHSSTVPPRISYIMLKLANIHCRFWALIIFSLLTNFSLGQTISPIADTPPAIPIALRSPYFNSWITTRIDSASAQPIPDLGGVRLWNSQVSISPSWRFHFDADEQPGRRNG